VKLCDFGLARAVMT